MREGLGASCRSRKLRQAFDAPWSRQKNASNTRNSIIYMHLSVSTEATRFDVEIRDVECHNHRVVRQVGFRISVDAVSQIVGELQTWLRDLIERNRGGGGSETRRR